MGFVCGEPERSGSGRQLLPQQAAMPGTLRVAESGQQEHGAVMSWGSKEGSAECFCCVEKPASLEPGAGQPVGFPSISLAPWATGVLMDRVSATLPWLASVDMLEPLLGFDVKMRNWKKGREDHGLGMSLGKQIGAISHVDEGLEQDARRARRVEVMVSSGVQGWHQEPMISLSKRRCLIQHS